MKRSEARRLIQVKVTPLSGLWHFHWEGGQAAQKLSLDQLVSLLRKLKAMDGQRYSRSTRSLTYLDMANGFSSGKNPLCWVWSNNLKTIHSNLKAFGEMRETVQAQAMVPPQNEVIQPDTFKMPKKTIAVSLPDGEYNGTIKGHCVTLDSGEKFDGFPFGLKNMFPLPVKMVVANGEATWKQLPRTQEGPMDYIMEDIYASDILNIAHQFHVDPHTVGSKIPGAVKLASQEFGKSPSSFGPKEHDYILNVLRSYFESNQKEDPLKEFIDSEKEPDEFISSALEDMTGVPKTPAFEKKEHAMRVDLKGFLESEKPVDEYIEDMIGGAGVTSNFPGSETLPQHAHAFPKKKEDLSIAASAVNDPVPPNPNEVTQDAIGAAEKAKSIAEPEGEIKVPETQAGTSYLPQAEPAPKPVDVGVDNLTKGEKI